MPSFPDTWTYTDFKTGGLTPQIVLPACHGSVRRVVTEISVKISNLVVGAGFYAPGVQLLDGVTAIGAANLRLLLLDLTQIQSDSADIIGPFQGSPATSLTVRLSAAFPASVNGSIQIIGYDL